MNDVSCILPYMHTLIQTNGRIKLCCNSLEDSQPHVTDQPFSELINNELHKTVRQKFQQGIVPNECRKCFEQEQNGVTSYRQEQNYFNSDKKKEVGLKYLDIRFNNTCNLKCVMCSSAFSTLWTEDELKLSKSETIWLKEDMESRAFGYDKNNFKWNSEDIVLENLKNNNDLERIHFAGGEPLLSKQHKELLHYLVDTGRSKEFMISYNTNIILIDEEIISLWNQFNRVKVFLSIDGIGDVLEYIRFPIQYSKVLEVFDLISKYSSKNIRYVFHYTLSALNLLSLPNFIDYKINLDNEFISPGELFTMDCVRGPAYLAINLLPKSLLDSVNDQLEQLKVKYPKYNNDIDKLQNKLLMEHKIPTNYTVNQLFQYCEELDRVRGTDSSFILDEIRTYL